MVVEDGDDLMLQLVADARGRKMAAVVPYTGSLVAGLAVAALPQRALRAKFQARAVLQSAPQRSAGRAAVR